MAVYHMPPDTKEKEKIIGGLFTWNQFFWLLGGFALGMIGFVVIYSLTSVPALSLIMALIGFSLSFPFVFIRRGELTLFEYIVRKHRFKKKSHLLINRRVIK